MGSDEARAALEDSAREVDAVVAELLPRLAEAAGRQVDGGTASYRLCGDPVPSGASYASGPKLGPSGTVASDVARSNIEALLETDGWELEEVENELVVVARRDGIQLRTEVGPALANLAFSTDCVDAPADVAREFSGRPSKDVPLP